MVQHSDKLALGELQSTMFPLLRPAPRKSQRVSYFGSARASIESSPDNPFHFPPIKPAKSVAPSIRISPQKLFGRVKMLNNQHLLVRDSSRPSRLSSYAKKVGLMMQRDYNRHRQTNLGARCKSKQWMEAQIPEIIELSIIGQKGEDEAETSTEFELLKFISC